MSTAASGRVSSRCMRGMASPNPFAATPSRGAAGDLAHSSPVAGLACELNSSLHLDSDGGSPARAPAFAPLGTASPFGATSLLDGGGPATPLLLQSRKRPMRGLGPPTMGSLGSPGMLGADSPSAALWSRSRSRRANTPLARATPAGLAPASAACTPAGHEGPLHPVDDDSSFDDDGSLTNLPRMRGSAIKTIMEDHMLDCTPLRSQASRIKRARGQSTAIPSFLPLAEAAALSAEDILGPSFSPSARSQPECHLLPCASAPTDSIMRVEAETVSRLLAGAYNGLYDERIVVDCRFPYEYEGGHIAGAVNAPTPEDLERLLLERQRPGRRVVVVLHCEYSIQRAPSMASHLRRRDRETNMHRYPHLDYPEIYVLKGGYRNFFSFHKPQCEPQSYVEMNDRQFAVDCRQRMLQFNRQFKRTKSMNDAALARSYSATVAGSTLFMQNAQSPTQPARSSAAVVAAAGSSSLPARARRLGRTQSARPGISIIDFSQR
ncbi:m-phase inducer phosphatase [Coemansia biformis]|uniref:M-phase inducer phosphatase n=1 Tax=Coemansia biformis TaxID=1286918 RepID=A0A9W7YCN8_9FUNG|nr:m-phase inducer phosphatase [Coemansia biformis]